MFPLNVNPSYLAGFAYTQDMSAFPEMWDGVIGAWAPFLGPTGQLMDWSGNANHGEINGPTWQGDALNFDGINDLVTSANKITLVNQVTYKAVVSYTSFAGSYDIVRNDDGDGNKGAILTTEDQKLKAYLHRGTLVNVPGDTTLVLNRFYRVALVYDGSTLKLYLDGKEDGSLVTSGNITDSNEFVTIGSYGVGNFFSGKMLQVSIYDVALNASEVAAWSRNPKGLFIRKPPVSYFVAAAPAGVAPTGVFYGPLYGPLSGPIG